MRASSVLAGLGLLALGACAMEPTYPVRPGEARAEFPKPSYPIRQSAEVRNPGSSPTPSSANLVATPVLVSSRASDEGGYYKPRPITDAPPPPDENGGTPSKTLREHSSPWPATPVRSSPTPALETPNEVRVRPGESLFEVAERVRSPVRSLIELNGLKSPYEVAPGSILKVPKPTIYSVVAGDTLFSIGRKFAIDPRSLANFNDISMGAGLKLGQRLALPASVTERGVKHAPAPLADTAELSEPAAKLKKSEKFEKAPAPAASAPHAAPAAAPEPEEPPSSAMAEAGKGKFIWPVKGDIISTFGPKGPGQRNDGINIAATTGDSVKAAAAGQVVYSGSTIPGFGNLVVIKHPDGWTSLYGNLGKIGVKIRTEVSKGQEIGVAGLSGQVERPQVHFEVRYAASPQDKARPVDPQQVLP